MRFKASQTEQSCGSMPTPGRFWFKGKSKENHPVSLGVAPPRSFQSFFLENHQKPWGKDWFLKRTMVEKNGGNQPLEFKHGGSPSMCPEHAPHH